MNDVPVENTASSVAPRINGQPIWLDLMTRDYDTAIAFYEGVFGWRTERGGEEFGGYSQFFVGDDVVAGCMVIEEAESPMSVWSTYLATDDIEATLAAVEAHGGSKVFGPDVVADFGTMAGLTDPSGAFVSLWQPNTHPGFVRKIEHGFPVWHEMCSKDFDATEEFYGKVFNYQLDTAFKEPFRYQTMTLGTWQFGGHMDAAKTMPEQVPSHWQVYFGVDDVDSACERVLAHKGQVLQPAFDTPYGRMALVADPFGALFMIMTGNLDTNA